MTTLTHTRAVDPNGVLWGEGETSNFSDAPDPRARVRVVSPMPQHPASHPLDLAAWLVESNVVIVSARSLGELGVARAKVALRALRTADLVRPTPTSGVYLVVGHPPEAMGVHFDLALACHLHANPESRISWGPSMLPVQEGWTARGHAVQYCVPTRARLPESFNALHKSAIHRWNVKAPLLWYGQTPCWRYETELVYVAARPHRYSLGELPDYLFDLAHASQLRHLLAELADQPRSVWMRTCLLLRYGSRRDFADKLQGVAPPGCGPYHFKGDGHLSRYRQPGLYSSTAIWHPNLEVMDYAIDATHRERTARYLEEDMPPWAVAAFESGRPEGFTFTPKSTSDLKDA